MSELVDRHRLGAQLFAALLHRTVHDLVVAAFCVAGSGSHVLLHSFSGLVTFVNDRLGISMRLIVFTGIGHYAVFGTGNFFGYGAHVVVTQSINIIVVIVLAAGRVTPVILTPVSGIAFRFTGRRRYAVNIEIMGACRHRYRVAAQFLFTDRAVHNVVVAARLFTGTILYVFLNGFAGGMVGSRHSGGFTAQFCITGRAVHHSVIAAVFLALGLHIVFNDGLGGGMGCQFEFNRVAVQLSITDRAVHNAVIAALYGTGRLNAVFLNGRSGGMSSQRKFILFSA